MNKINNPKILSDDMLRSHIETVKQIQLDILKQVEFYEEATGDTKDCYKKIILDKIWKLKKIVAEFYYLSSSAIDELEGLVGEPMAYRMMCKEGIDCLTSSYTASAHQANVPLPPHH